MSLTWEDPPDTNTRVGRGGKRAAVIAQLRSRPGQWAKIGDYRTYAVAYQFKKMAGPDFRFIARKIGPDTMGVWGVYLPNGEPK